MSDKKKTVKKTAEDSIQIPSKTFLMGEYSVLMGGRALVLTHSPCFLFNSSFIAEDPDKKFHPESPAGKVLKDHKKEQNFSFVDPHEGAGGFGGSTAEYLAASFSCEEGVQRRELMEKYFSYFESEKTPPSGADLCAQSFLSEGVVEYSKEPLQAVHHNWPFLDTSILIFKTSNKVKTHKHLEELFQSRTLENLNDLANFSEDTIEAFVKKDEALFLSGLNEFTKEQAMQGLLHENTMKLIYQVNQIKGVKTSRGCGAMGADVLAVFVKPDLKDYVLNEISKQELGLKLVFSSPV